MRPVGPLAVVQLSANILEVTMIFLVCLLEAVWPLAVLLLEGTMPAMVVCSDKMSTAAYLTEALEELQTT